MKSLNHTSEPSGNFKLYNYNCQEVPLMLHMPPGYERYSIPGSKTYSATGDFGTMIFQEVSRPLYSICICHYFTEVREKFTGRLKAPSLGIHFLLKNNLIYKLYGFDWQTLKETQYNIISTPTVKNETYFKAKDYLTFDIHPDMELLSKLAPRYNRLRNFIKKAESGEFVQLFDRNQFATPKMLYMVKQLLEYFYRNIKCSLDVDYKVEQLIKLSLFGNPSPNHRHFKFYEIEKLYQAEHLMRQYMDEKNVLEKQQSKIFMDKGRFRDGFLQIFDELPHVHLNRQRMEKARQLLRSSEILNIEDIAYRVGYQNPSNFTVAYKKFYGIPPVEERAENR